MKKTTGKLLKLLLKNFIFWQYWCFNSGPHACWAGAVPLEPCPQPFFALVVFSGKVLHYC
jgi:hypothetical protein